MKPRIDTLREKKLIGMKVKMSFSNNRTRELWKNFMPKRGKIKNRIGTEFFSVEVYDPVYFKKFNPKNVFYKWAAVEVSNFDNVPDEMNNLSLPTGLYAVFVHKGPADSASKTYRYIYNTWLPNSDYSLDNRPHFAIMGEKYKPDDPNSEEEIWIPVTKE